MRPTSQQVMDFWAHMTSIYGTTVKTKANAQEMRLIGEALGIIGIVDTKAFMTRFSTTIGKTIYTSFDVGVETKMHPLWSQMVICAHEHEHVLQDKDRSFALKYLMDETWRAAYEGEAYRTSMTLETWRTGKVPSIEGYVKAMQSYGVGKSTLGFFRRYLELSLPVLEQGGIPGDAAKTAIHWLEKNAPELKG